MCGEGGEYETLVLDCPLFRRGTIELCRTSVLSSSDPVSPVGLLRVDEMRVRGKGAECDSGEVLWVEEEAPTVERSGEVEREKGPGDAAKSSRKTDMRWEVHAGRSGGWVHMAATVWARREEGSGEAAGAISDDEMADAVALALDGVRLKALGDLEVVPVTGIAPEPVAGLGEGGAWAEGEGRGEGEGAEGEGRAEREERNPLSSAGLLHLYLRDMKAFGCANAAYVRCIPLSLPPSRACVQPCLEELDYSKEVRREGVMAPTCSWVPAAILSYYPHTY